MSTLLEVRDLHVEIPVDGGILHAVRGVDLSVSMGETLCIVGESGCGKSLTSLALMRLLPRRAVMRAERLHFAGLDMRAVSERAMTDIRGRKMSMIFQDPMTSLNPSYTVGDQLEEIYLRHMPGSRRDARDRALLLLDKVGIAQPRSRLGQFPHELSGGLRQRVIIAMALMCSPQLIVADEPTTALDVTVQTQILRLIKDLQSEFGMALVLITHDLGVVARTADRVAVMYAGQFVETGTARDVFNAPEHPYTRGLLACIPVPGKVKRGQRLGSIRGTVPTLLGHMEGCAFASRCSHAQATCRAGQVDVVTAQLGHAYRCRLDPSLRSIGVVTDGV